MRPDCTLMWTHKCTCLRVHTHRHTCPAHTSSYKHALMQAPPHICTHEPSHIHPWVHAQHARNLPTARLSKNYPPPRICVLGGDPSVRVNCMDRSPGLFECGQGVDCCLPDRDCLPREKPARPADRFCLVPGSLLPILPKDP